MVPERDGHIVMTKGVHYQASWLRSNDAARATWNATAVGGRRALGAEPGSLDYFERIRAYRYGYETPFIPRLLGFADMAGKRVLEIGVGVGIDAMEMIAAGADYHGIDITRNHLDLTARNLELHEAHGVLIERDLLSADVPGAPFDIVYSFGVLHHIAHEAQYLERARSLLKPGGRLIIAVYSKYSFFNAYLLATWLGHGARVPFDAWRSHVAEESPLDAPVTIKVRSKRAVRQLLENAGFRVVRYHKRGFVQRYLPGIGRFLAPDGLTLNALGALLGWYHIFACEPV